MRSYPPAFPGLTAEQANALASRWISSLTGRELIFDTPFQDCDSDGIPDAAHPQEFHLHEEICFAPLTSENLALHNLVHGNVYWNIPRSEPSHSSDEVMVQGQPVKRRASIDAYCHCGKCNWNWFLQGWVCWPEQQ